MTRPVIGFIGLGLMGGNMVENLQNRGFELVVMDLNKDAVAAVVARGNAREAASPKETGRGQRHRDALPHHVRSRRESRLRR